HRWRAEEQAILVGSRTALADDPALTVRHVAGRQPLRVVLDRGRILPDTLRVLTSEAPTLLFSAAPRPDLTSVEQCILPAEAEPIPFLLAELHRRQVRSVLVEGGAELLGHFLA